MTDVLRTELPDAAGLDPTDPNLAARPEGADAVDHEALVGDFLDDPAAVIADTTLAVVEFNDTPDPTDAVQPPAGTS